MNKHDLVYRNQVIDILKKNMAYAIFDEEGNYTTRGLKLLENINLVPPAQQKQGKWILSYSNYRLKSDPWYKCSQCKNETQYATNFCPNCGASMRSENNEFL